MLKVGVDDAEQAGIRMVPPVTIAPASPRWFRLEISRIRVSEAEHARTMSGVPSVLPSSTTITS